MNLLLDTHIAIWAVENNPRLSAAARALLSAPNVDAAVSVASLWEIAIKHALGRSGADAIPMSAAVAEGFFLAAGFAILPVTSSHVRALESLPPVHKDPFDRLIVAAAYSEPRRLVTQDRRLAGYPGLVSVV